MDAVEIKFIDDEYKIEKKEVFFIKEAEAYVETLEEAEKIIAKLDLKKYISDMISDVNSNAVSYEDGIDESYISNILDYIDTYKLTFQKILNKLINTKKVIDEKL